MKHDEKKILIKHIRLNVGFFRIWFVVIIIIERAVEYASKRALTTQTIFRLVAMIPWISFESIQSLSIDLQPINRLFDHWQSTHSSGVLSRLTLHRQWPDNIISNVIIVFRTSGSSTHWFVVFFFWNFVHALNSSPAEHSKTKNCHQQVDGNCQWQRWSNRQFWIEIEESYSFFFSNNKNLSEFSVEMKLHWKFFLCIN